jgi:valyl-tRNA synthetase
MNTEGEDCGQAGGEVELSVADRWIVSRLQSTEVAVTDAIEGYRFDHAAQAIYEFTWNAYCDWYLELSKPVLNSETSGEAARRGTRQTLVQVLEALLRLTHPIMPYITEEIWQRVAPLAGVSGETIMLQPFPAADETRIDSAAVAEMEWLMQFILGVRRIRGEMNIAPGKPLDVLLQNAGDRDKRWLEASRQSLNTLGRLASIEVLAADAEAPESATALVGEMKVLIPMAGLIDKEAELVRLEKELDKLTRELEKSQNKLANKNFVERAPSAVVEKEKKRAEEQRKAIAQLNEQLEKIRGL